MSRERDYSYEALAEVTGSHQTANRGELNVALKSIREQEPELEDSYLLGAEIHERAKLYRELMPDTMLTPTALAKHWTRVVEESKQKRRQHSGTNLGTQESRYTPLPKKEKPPEWVAVWYFARHHRKPRSFIPFPQQKGFVDDALCMSMDEYEGLRQEWMDAGAPGFKMAELVAQISQRNYAAETTELLKEISDAATTS